MSDSDVRQPRLLHRLEFILFRGIELLLSCLSIATATSLGRMAGRLFYTLSPRYRRLVRRNLRIATANDGLGPAELHELTLETFRRAGANFLGALRTPMLDLETVHEIATEDGTDLMAGRGPGRTGLVVTMSHMGNWEAMARLSKDYVGEAEYGGVYRPLENPLMDALTRERRTMDGAVLFSRKDGFHAPAALLKRGGSLGILADHRAGGRGAVLPFFGKLTTCSPLPALLARRGRADVSVLSIVTQDAGHWRMILRPLHGEAGAEAIMAELERGMRRSLADVFWLHDRWRIDSRRPLSLFARLDPERAAEATVPLRLVVTLPADLGPAARERLFEDLFRARPDLRLELLEASPSDPPREGVAVHVWDPQQPPEHADGTLRRIDESHPAPLDGALLFGSEAGLARAAKRLGLRAIIGLDVAGKPWTHSFARPTDQAGWKEIVDELSWIPDRYRK